MTEPAIGGPGQVFRITAGPFPAGTISTPTEVLIEIGAPDGRPLGPIVATLAPGARQLTVDYNQPDPSPEPSRPPLEVGRYAVHAEDNGHVCVASGMFEVTP